MAKLLEQMPSRLRQLPELLPPAGAFVTLSEAVSWIAYRHAMDLNQLYDAFHAHPFEIADAQSAIADAIRDLTKIATDGTLRLQGKYLTSLDDNEQIALTEIIDPIRLNDFARFDVLYDGLRHGTGLLYSNDAFDLAFAQQTGRRDHYVRVTVEREALLTIFEPTLALGQMPLDTSAKLSNIDRDLGWAPMSRAIRAVLPMKCGSTKTGSHFTDPYNFLMIFVEAGKIACKGEGAPVLQLPHPPAFPSLEYFKALTPVKEIWGPQWHSRASEFWCEFRDWAMADNLFLFMAGVIGAAEHDIPPGANLAEAVRTRFAWTIPEAMAWVCTRSFYEVARARRLVDLIGRSSPHIRREQWAPDAVASWLGRLVVVTANNHCKCGRAPSSDLERWETCRCLSAAYSDLLQVFGTDQLLSCNFRRHSKIEGRFELDWSDTAEGYVSPVNKILSIWHGESDHVVEEETEPHSWDDQSIKIWIRGKMPIGRDEARKLFLTEPNTKGLSSTFDAIWKAMNPDRGPGRPAKNQ